MTRPPVWAFDIRGVSRGTIGIETREKKQMFHVERGARENHIGIATH
jgi:hypothetical protein